MGLYNMLMGRNPLTPQLLGIIGYTTDNASGPETFGRFRDVYTNEDCTKVFILTRNYSPDIEGRDWTHIDEFVAKNPNFVQKTADSDPTYQIYEFNVPEFFVTKDIMPGTQVNVWEVLRSRVPAEYRIPAMDRYRAFIQAMHDNALPPEKAKHVEVVGKAIVEQMKQAVEGGEEHRGIVTDSDSGGSVKVESLKNFLKKRVDSGE